MFERIAFVAFDHLSFDHGVMADTQPERDVITLVESQRMLTGRPWHPERLFFMVSAARHFAEEARERGFTVRYVQAATTVEGLESVRAEFGPLPIVSAEPSSPLRP